MQFFPISHRTLQYYRKKKLIPYAKLGGVTPDYFINYDKTLVSRGDLSNGIAPPPLFPVPLFSSLGKTIVASAGYLIPTSP